MLEFSGITFIICSVIDLFLKTGNSMNFFFIGILLIITSMLIKTHYETVQIKNYIGDSKKDKKKED